MFPYSYSICLFLKSPFHHFKDRFKKAKRKTLGGARLSRIQTTPDVHQGHKQVERDLMLTSPIIMGTGNAGTNRIDKVYISNVSTVLL